MNLNPRISRMYKWIVFLFLGLITEVSCESNECNSSYEFLLDYNIGEDRLDAERLSTFKPLGTFAIPYAVFGLTSNQTDVDLNSEGTILLIPSPDIGLGGLLVKGYDLDSELHWSGDFYYRYTDDAADLEKINSFVCNNFSAQSAMVFTYSCMTSNVSSPGPVANYQVVFASGPDENSDVTNLLFIIYDVVREVEVTGNYSAYLEYVGIPGKYPLPVANKTMLIINVTSQDGFTDGVEPDMMPYPCPSTEGVVRCSITRDRVVTGFDNQVVMAPESKVDLAVWNPGQNPCKFKFLTNYKDGYLWSSMAVGPHKISTKFYRYIEFDRYPGKISQRGWQCKTGCKGVISSFDVDIGPADGSIVYATIRELVPGSEYLIDSDLCSHDAEPAYRLTYNFDAAANEPVAILELSADFFNASWPEMTGLCLDYLQQASTE